MSGVELVAGVIGIFFIAGIAVGVLAVVALPQLHRSRRRASYLTGSDWAVPPDVREEDEPPRWPGG